MTNFEKRFFKVLKENDEEKEAFELELDDDTSPDEFDVDVEADVEATADIEDPAIKAAEAKIIKLSDDQRSFSWASNGKKLMTVPFDENPYSAMAAFFKTDEGVEVFKSIEKKLK